MEATFKFMIFTFTVQELWSLIDLKKGTQNVVGQNIVQWLSFVN